MTRSSAHAQPKTGRNNPFPFTRNSSTAPLIDLKAGNFLRAEDKLKYAYLLTPEGMTAKLQLTRAYLARQEQEYVAMKAEIEAMRAELADHDVRG